MHQAVDASSIESYFVYSSCNVKSYSMLYVVSVKLCLMCCCLSWPGHSCKGDF